MRSITLFFVSTLFLFASGFPETFNSAGDEVYESMQKYLKIKDMKIYQEKPEFLESFCLDANASMKKGFALDKAKEDPEMKMDKEQIKAYARELRRLSEQNEAILMQLQTDIKRLYQEGDMQSLVRIEEAGLVSDKEISKAIAEYKKQQAVDEAIAKANRMQAEQIAAIEKVQKVIVEEKPESAVEMPEIDLNEVPEAVASEVLIDEAGPEEELVMPEAKTEEPAKELTELEYYQQSLIRLKEELYTLRESGADEPSDLNSSPSSETKMACLNDITAINYWMIKVLENERDACALSDAIRQMKSYDKSAAASCGRESMRYIEWHGRIKPHVGSRLFQAEASCHR